MAQYYNDFTAASVGDLPIGASLTRGSVSGDYSVQLQGGVNQLRYRAPSGGTLARGLRYSIESAGVTELYTIITDIAPSDPASGRLIAFASDGPDNEYGVVLNFSLNTVATYRRVSGTFTAIGTAASITLNAGSYYKARFRVTPGSPNRLQARVWAEAGEEPGTWLVDVTDSERTLSGGWLGHIGFAQGVNVFFKEIGIGTNGDPAPTEPVVASRRRSPLLLTPW